MQKIWQRVEVSKTSQDGKLKMIVEPTLLYGTEVWILNVKDEQRLMLLREMICAVPVV